MKQVGGGRVQRPVVPAHPVQSRRARSGLASGAGPVCAPPPGSGAKMSSSSGPAWRKSEEHGAWKSACRPSAELALLSPSARETDRRATAALRARAFAKRDTLRALAADADDAPTVAADAADVMDVAPAAAPVTPPPQSSVTLSDSPYRWPTGAQVDASRDGADAAPTPEQSPAFKVGECRSRVLSPPKATAQPKPEAKRSSGERDAHAARVAQSSAKAAAIADRCSARLAALASAAPPREKARHPVFDLNSEKAVFDTGGLPFGGFGHHSSCRSNGPCHHWASVLDSDSDSKSDSESC
jgi:hypothetical protein